MRQRQRCPQLRFNLGKGKWPLENVKRTLRHCFKNDYYRKNILPLQTKAAWTCLCLPGLDHRHQPTAGLLILAVMERIRSFSHGY